MTLDQIWISDESMKPIGDIRAVEGGWLSMCAFCNTPLREIVSNDQGVALMALLQHVSDKHEH